MLKARYGLVLIAAMLAVSACKSGGDRRAERDDDVVVPIEEVPAQVRQTIEAHLNGGKVREIELSSDDGKQTYDVEVDGANGPFEFEVAPDGTFLGMDAEDEDDEKDAD